MEKTVLYAGSFDPVTTGHEALVRRALSLFDHVVVALGDNRQKACRFPLAQREAWLRRTFCDEPRVEVAVYHGLTTDYCRRRGITVLLRGLRGDADFQYEETIANVNRAVAPDIETLFLLSDAGHAMVSSSMLRELLSFGHDISAFLPVAIRDDFPAPGKDV